jgi:hypothetical protein
MISSSHEIPSFPKITLPNVLRLGEKSKKITKNSNIRIVFKSADTLRSQLVHFKPKDSKLIRN